MRFEERFTRGDSSIRDSLTNRVVSQDAWIETSPENTIYHDERQKSDTESILLHRIDKRSQAT